MITTHLYFSWQLSRNTSFVIGMTRSIDLVQRWTLLTRPSWPTLRSTTRPKVHALRDTFSSIISTSPRFGFFSKHFWRQLSSSMYSFTQRLRECPTMNCACHRCFRYASVFRVAGQGKEWFPFDISKRLGVSGSSSCTSSLTLVSG